MTALRQSNIPLGQLQSTSNWDKHKVLLPRYAAAADASFEVRWSRKCAPVLRWHQSEGALEPRTESPLAVFDANPTGDGKPEMAVDFRFRPSVGLAGMGDTLELLDGMAAKVLRIIREFEPLFGQLADQIAATQTESEAEDPASSEASTEKR